MSSAQKGSLLLKHALYIFCGGFADFSGLFYVLNDLHTPTFSILSSIPFRPLYTSGGLLSRLLVNTVDQSSIRNKG